MRCGLGGGANKMFLPYNTPTLSASPSGEEVDAIDIRKPSCYVET